MLIGIISPKITRCRCYSKFHNCSLFVADIPPPLGFIFSLYANNGFYLFRRFSRLLGLMSISFGDYRSFIFQVRSPCTMPTATRCERQGVVSCLSLHILALGRFLPWNIGREPAVQGRCVPCTHRIVAVCTLELSSYLLNHLFEYCHKHINHDTVAKTVVQ